MTPTDTSKPYSEFRHWVQTIWEENCVEHDEFREPRFTQQQYFQKYKYWLRGRYQQLQRQGQI